MNEKAVLQNLRTACGDGIEIMPGRVLCESVSAVGMHDPLLVSEGTSLQEALSLLQQSRIGSLIITNEAGKVAGIFTERDCVRKLLGKVQDLGNHKISEFMTPDPKRERPDITLGYVLNIMSVGGFRHLPIVDDEDFPIGVISVEDVMDFFVKKMLSVLGL